MKEAIVVEKHIIDLEKKNTIDEHKSKKVTLKKDRKKN